MAASFLFYDRAPTDRPASVQCCRRHGQCE